MCAHNVSSLKYNVNATIVSSALYDVIHLEPTAVEDRYECYPYDTMDERRDIRCQVRSIIEEKLSLLFREPPEDGSGRPENPSGRPGGPLI